MYYNFIFFCLGLRSKSLQRAQTFHGKDNCRPNDVYYINRAQSKNKSGREETKPKMSTEALNENLKLPDLLSDVKDRYAALSKLILNHFT